MTMPAYMINSVLICVIVYPLPAHWAWNQGGWLNKAGFIDFAGSGVVHMVGGLCGLVGTVMIGPRIGRYDTSGKPLTIAGSSIIFQSMGVWFLVFGWFGFNGGSTLALVGDGEQRASVACVNTAISACAGGKAALVIFAVACIAISREHTYAFSIYMYVCMHIYIYIYMHTYIHTIPRFEDVAYARVVFPIITHVM
jgi:ammonia channel protein AmtB